MEKEAKASHWFDILEVAADEAVQRNCLSFPLRGKQFQNVVQMIITRRVWFTQESVGVEQFGPNTFLFSFQIWTTWVQIHGLPLHEQFMKKDNAIKICEFFHSNPTQCTNIVGMKYIMLQVEVDLKKPLQAGIC